MATAKNITVSFVPGIGYNPGDYAVLYGNGGEGVIDWNTPISEHLDLFPGGAGIYGWLQTPWLESPWLEPFSMGTAGWLQELWLAGPWLLGFTVISASVKAAACGLYKFAFACYDSLGNQHEGVPEEISVDVHVAPSAPAGLKKHSYNKDADILILDVNE